MESRTLVDGELSGAPQIDSILKYVIEASSSLGEQDRAEGLISLNRYKSQFRAADYAKVLIKGVGFDQIIQNKVWHQHCLVYLKNSL